MEMIILIGLQGAGKSTFYRTYFAETHELVSKDLLRTSKSRNKNLRQTECIEEAFREHHAVVIDNTNVTVAERVALIQLGKAYHVQVIGYYFEAGVKQCLERNRGREGKMQVPDKAIYITAARLVRPTYAEGFDKLYYVQSGENGSFLIREWVEEADLG
ncbi:MAG: ATP-binding protein [Ktedonobacteraceae bacterium]